MKVGQVIDNIVPSLESNIGAPTVDYGEISSVLSQAGQALDMVRSSSFGQNLTNIAYIYNTTEGGAFGVFDPNMDRTVKVKLVEDEMTKRGYDVDYRDGQLYAWMPGKSAEEVKEEMDAIYQELDLKGGLVIGINASNILNVAQKNFNDLKALPGDDTEFDEYDLNQLIALHLGATIVHESIHALGAKDEGAPIAAQRSWTAEQLSKMNSKRVAEGKSPLEMGTDTYTALTAPSMSKWAQIGYQEYVLPEAFLRVFEPRNDMAFPVEREPNDSLETVLNKNEHRPIPASFILQEELAKQHTDKDSENMIMEDLLDEMRPHPLLTPIKRTAGINSNVGGPFISSAFSIDEWLPRVLDGRDITDRIDYKEGEDPYWQKRYKPENVTWGKDNFGRMTYKYDEKIHITDYNTNNPMTWNQLFREDIVTGPWRKMASEAPEASNESKNGALSIMRTVGYYDSLIQMGKRKAVRFICDDSVAEQIMRLLPGKIVRFDHDENQAVWLYGPETNEKEVAEIESKITENRDSSDVNDFASTAEEIKSHVNFVISKVRDIAVEHGIKDVYIVGGFPRMLAGHEDYLDVNDLDFTSANPSQCLKLGGLLAEELNADDMSIYHRTMTLSFSHRGLKLDFRGQFIPFDVRPLLRKNNIPASPLNHDIYARDFTINSLLYDFMNNKIYDVSGHGVGDLKKKLVRTHFDPDVVIPASPLVATRAIIMALRGYTIAPELRTAIMNHSQDLFTGSLTDLRLAYECDKILGYTDGLSALEEFGLGRLKEIRDKAEKNNPELFSEG